MWTSVARGWRDVDNLVLSVTISKSVAQIAGTTRLRDAPWLGVSLRRQPGLSGTATPSIGSTGTARTARTHPESLGISNRLNVNPRAANWS